MVFQMKELKRSEQREQAFAIIFERIFNDVPLDELMDNALLARDFELCDYAQKTAEGVAQNLAEIDAQIEQYAVGWKKQRFSRVALAILRLAVYEMKFSKDVPVAVAVMKQLNLQKNSATPAVPRLSTVFWAASPARNLKCSLPKHLCAKSPSPAGKLLRCRE